MSRFYVRPHHSLCMQFFEGKGYDERFITSTARMLEMLSHDDPVITLTAGCDAFCSACPNNTGGVCRDREKVASVDKRTLNALGLDEDDQIHWSRLLDLARRRIILTGRLREICGSCQWSGICNNFEYD